MTNKPMLSVDRELLERAASAIEKHHGSIQWVIASDLRALLDKPVLESQYEGMTQDQAQAVSDGVDEILNGKQAAQHHGDPVAWSYCPECGCEELRHEEGEHKQCANCHQEWFSDIDYSEVVRGNLQKLKAGQPAPISVMPEVDELAQIIRKVDGSHNLGAGSLAESILEEVARLNGFDYGK